MKTYDRMTVLELRVNGDLRRVTARPSDLLMDVLREQLGLTGAKPGCRNGDCGACTIIVDGGPVKSCLMLAVEAVGREILTVEGLGGNTPIQQAFVDADAFQCGYCTSGFLMASHALCLQNPKADEYEMESWLESNVCRCTSYQEIRGAVKAALQETAERGGIT
jgi:carbon-monoxide dehydrogenase small subunit